MSSCREDIFYFTQYDLFLNDLKNTLKERRGYFTASFQSEHDTKYPDSEQTIAPKGNVHKEEKQK